MLRNAEGNFQMFFSNYIKREHSCVVALSVHSLPIFVHNSIAFLTRETAFNLCRP